MILIQLTEVMKDGAGMKERPIWINPEIIATLAPSELDNGAIPIIGLKEIKPKLTFIEYRNSRGAFVSETAEEIVQKITLAAFAERT